MPPNSRIGEAVALSATLQPPPEPIEPGGFDFGRQAWFASLGATGYATSKIQSLNDAGALPWDLRAWSGIDALRARVNARIRAALEGETGEIAVALITGAREAFPGVEPGYARFGPRAHPFHFRPALYLEGLSIWAESVGPQAMGAGPCGPQKGATPAGSRQRRSRSDQRLGSNPEE